MMMAELELGLRGSDFGLFGRGTRPKSSLGSDFAKIFCF
jgi:hypothetical protein